MAEKSKFVIILSCFDIFFFEIVNNELKPLNHQMTDKKSFSMPGKLLVNKNLNTMSFCNLNKMLYPSFVIQYYEPSNLLHYENEPNEIITDRIKLTIESILEHLNKVYPQKKEITFFAMGILPPDLSKINVSIEDKSFKSMCPFIFELGILINKHLLNTQNAIYMVTDLAIETFVNKNISFDPLLKHFEELENLIRNKYYFLAKHDNSNVSHIAIAFFYELFKENRQYECIYQDISIMFTEEEYKQIEDLIVDSYYNSIKDFYEKHPNSFYINYINSKVGNRLFQKALERLGVNLPFIHLANIFPLIYDFHRLNHFGSVCMYNKVKHLNYGFEYKIFDNEFIERSRYLTKEERLNMKQKLQLLSRKGKENIDNYFIKEEVQQL